MGLHVLGACRPDQRVHDRVERLSRLFVAEDEVAELLSVEPTVFIEQVFAEFVHELLEAGRTGLHHFAREVVGVDDWDAELAEHLRHGGLPAGDPSCKTYDRFHRGRVLNIISIEQDDSACATPPCMRAVVQRVNEASVAVDGHSVGAIERGLLVYLGAAQGDDEKDVKYTADKIAGLRIFPNDDGRMSLSVVDVGGAVLVVSQFTLFGDVRRGRRPSFDGAAEPEVAERLYLEVVAALRAKGLAVETGTFRAMMLVQSVVDGPVTIQIDSQKLY